MAADFNKPVTTDSYVDLLAMLRDNQQVLARMFASGTAVDNIPVGSVRFDSGKFQTWNGSAWVDVPVSVDGGGTGAQSAAAARVALGTNNAANLTTGVMSADRVPGLDASKIVSGTLTRDTSGNAATATYATSAGSAAAAPWSGITGKPAVIGAGATALEAREAIGAVGNGLDLVWSGSATSVDLDLLTGGYPGDGWYIIDALFVSNTYSVPIFVSGGLTRSLGNMSTGSGSTDFLVVSVGSSNILEAKNYRYADGATFGSHSITTCTITAIYKVV